MCDICLHTVLARLVRLKLSLRASLVLQDLSLVAIYNYDHMIVIKYLSTLFSHRREFEGGNVVTTASGFCAVSATSRFGIKIIIIGGLNDTRNILQRRLKTYGSFRIRRREVTL